MSELQVLSKLNHAKKTAPIRIMQFGEGNFLRAFVDWMIQKMNDSNLYNGHVVVVQPLEFGRVKELEKQDGLYTVILQGLNEEGEAVKEGELIDVLDDFVNPYSEYDKYLKYAESKDLEVVVSNTTEAGIAFEEKDVAIDLEKETPCSYPGKLLALLKRRYEVLGKDFGLALMPCELIDDNGDKLKEVLVKLAKARNESEGLIDFIENSCHYTTTLVDRIVPGFPRDEFSELCAKFGYVDNNMVKGEYFHLFVLKNEPFVEEKFPVHKVGLHAIYVPDVHPYKARKVRILNGSHTSLVPVAYLAGFNEVRESLLDEEVSKFLKEEIYEEIVPTIDVKDVENFADDVYQRFLNPFVHHALMSIALNSISKFKERDLPTLLDNYSAKKVYPRHLTYALASLIKFYEGIRVVDGKEEKIELKDTPSYLEAFESYYKAFNEDKDVSSLIHKVLSNVEFWGRDLSLEEGLEAEVIKYFTHIISSSSAYKALEEFNKHAI